MIPFDFAYYRPLTIEEAVQIYQEHHKQGKNVIYYGGGTEFITFARKNKMVADVVIDIKKIPACTQLKEQGDQFIFGSAVTLNQVAESNLFPLLTQKVKKIADHTSRNKITLGGNLNSQLMYREAILPFLLADAKVKLAGREGEMTLPLQDIFDKQLNINSCQFIVQVLVEKSYAALPFISIKRTMRTQIDYPLVSIAAIVKDDFIRTAFSGVCEFPFRSDKLEDLLNDTSLSLVERINEVLKQLPAPIVQDIRGSSEYRAFVLENVLSDTMEALEWARK